MTSKGRFWGQILVVSIASIIACDSEPSSSDGGGGAGGEQPQAGVSSVNAGGFASAGGGAGQAGEVAVSSGQAGQVDGGVASGGVASGGVASGGLGGVASGGLDGEAGESLGGSDGQALGPTALSCPDDASGGIGGYGPASPLGGVGGTAAEPDAEFHRVTLGTNQTVIAINDIGKMLIRSGWAEADSCQAWVVDAESVNEVTTGTTGCVLAIDMNEAGTVLASQGSVPFLWKDGVATPLEGVASGIPVALNDAEQVLLAASPIGPALWETGSLTALRTPTDEALQPVAINESGQIIGYSGGDQDRAEATWLWQNGAASALGLSSVHALNDVGDIVGVKDRAEEGILSRGIFTPLTTNPGGLTPTDLNDMRIHAMTDDGILVGDVYAIGEPDLARPFRFADGVGRYLATYGSARDINRYGEIVGRSYSVRFFGPATCDCWGVERVRASLWVQDCPVACCAP